MADELGVEDFCSAVERAYNFKVEREHLTPQERRVFAALFDVVVFFTPFDHERLEVPEVYKGPSDVAAAAQRA